MKKFVIPACITAAVGVAAAVTAVIITRRNNDQEVF